MSNNYNQEHGDLYALGDRHELGVQLNGIPYSFHPNAIYIAGQNISKGYGVALANAAFLTANPGFPGAAGQAYYAVEGVMDKMIGIALNTAVGGSVITLGTLTGVTFTPTVKDTVTTWTVAGTASNTGSVIVDGVSRTISNAQTATQIAATLSGFGTVGNYTYASVSAGVFTATTNASYIEVLDRGIYNWSGIIPSSSTLTLGTLTGVTFTPAISASTTSYTVGGTVTNGSTGTVTVNGVVYTFNNGQTAAQITTYFAALGTVGNYTFSAVSSTVFLVTTNMWRISDLGNTAYVLATSYAGLTSPTQQFTTDRNAAAATGNPLIELGIVKTLNEVFIDFEGDSRGATGLTSVSPNAGEYLYSPTPGLDVSGTTPMTSGAPGGTSFTTPFLVSLGTDGNVYVADRRKSQGGATPNRNNICGFVSAAGTWPATPGLIPVGTACVVSKAGILSGFSGLTPGGIVYADKNGGFTQNVANFSYFTDVAVPIGFAFTATSIYVEIGFSTQTSDGNSIGAQYAMRNATPDAGYLAANGNALNPVGLTTTTLTAGAQLTGANAGLASIDSTALFGFIGTTYGGTIQWTISGTVTAGNLFYINGVQYSVSGSTAASLATQIGGISQAGYTFSNPTSGVFAIQNASSVLPPTISFGSPFTAVFTITGGTYNLPNYTGTPAIQIKYVNLYQANPPQAPVFRYDSNWVTWGSLPSGAGAGSNITLGSNGSYIEFPSQAFGYDLQLTDAIVEFYVSKGGVVRRIDPLPIISGANKYGYQLAKDIPNYFKLEFAQNGIAYFDTASTQTYIAIDSTWQYRFYVYKPQQFNRFYDYTQDQWFSQFKALQLIGYTSSVTTPSPGFLDRSSTAPTDATRLNYNGNLYFTNGFVSNALTVAGGPSSFTGNLTLNGVTSVVSSSLRVLNGATVNWVSDPLGNVTQSGNLVITAGSATITGSVQVNNNTLSLFNGATQEFLVDTGGSIANAGNIVAGGNINANGGALDSTASTFALLATPGTTNVGTFGSGAVTVQSSTLTARGSAVVNKGLLQIGANSTDQTVEAELDFWKKLNTLPGAKLIMNSTTTPPNLGVWIENGAGSHVNIATFSSQGVTPATTAIGSGSDVFTVVPAGGSGLYLAAVGALHTPDGAGASTHQWYIRYTGNSGAGDAMAWKSGSPASDRLVNTQVSGTWGTWMYLNTPVIGTVYIQGPADTDPNTLWPGSFWQNKSSEEATLFRRFEGSGNVFQSGTQAMSMADHEHNSGIALWRNSGTTAIYGENGGGGGAATANVQDSHAQGGNSYGALTSTMIGGSPGTEVRPVNVAVRKWRRTA